MKIQKIQVRIKESPNILAKRVKDQLRRIGFNNETVTCSLVYRFEGITQTEAEKLALQALTDPLTQTSCVNKDLICRGTQKLEISYKPGVMNPIEQSLFKVTHALGITPKAISHSVIYFFPEKIDHKKLQKIGNYLVSQVERVVWKEPKTLKMGSKTGPVKIVKISRLNEKELIFLSDKRRLFLNGQEMIIIQNYFRSHKKEPTDIEIETLAQTWSEHCGHKTFKAKLIDEQGCEKIPLIQRIRRTSEKYYKRVGVVTAFKDNAGGFRFYDRMVIIAKGETHNSPVAVEPYGGSLTKNGGVYRDIAGCGLGGHNILGLMINCVGLPDAKAEDIPQGTLHPKLLLLENSRGERDYGNRMGIPTHETSLYFHSDFGPKPTSLGVVVGIIPEKNSQKGKPKPGDLIISIGGRTGRDGIHGATFSSGEMTTATSTIDATAVQIGNAIEEKRTFDALIAARNKGLIRAVTDCGGGGYSSAVGEMGKNVGVEINLDKVPLKYSGLSPWEIWLSESQERMMVAVNPNNLDAFLKVCQTYEAPTTVLGKFTGDRLLTLKYGGKTVGKLSMEFLHDGLPQREMKIKYEAYPEDKSVPPIPTDYKKLFLKVLAHLNICSKEEMLRQYDQTVQGMTVLAPFTGVHEDMPNDASIVVPIYGKPYGVVTAHALNPKLMRIDPYEGTKWAVALAAAKLTAVGGNINQAAMIDNFIWPKPDEKFLGDLDRSVDALCLMMNTLKIPCVSGKDSLSSTFKDENKIINIPPVLNMTVFSKIPDVEKTVSGDIKEIGSILVLVGQLDLKNLGGSIYFETNNIVNNHGPKIDVDQLPEVLKVLHRAIQTGEVKACKTVGEGGLGVTLSEMCFGGDCGAKIDLSRLNAERPDFALYSETAGCFVAEIKDEKTAKKLFGNIPYSVLGKTTKDKKITINDGDKKLLDAQIDELKEAWKKPMKEILK